LDTKNYSIYVSRNDSAFSPWITNVTDTAARYVGSPGNLYRFFSAATDYAGNAEQMKLSERGIDTGNRSS